MFTRSFVVSKVVDWLAEYRQEVGGGEQYAQFQAELAHVLEAQSGTLNDAMFAMDDSLQFKWTELQKMLRDRCVTQLQVPAAPATTMAHSSGDSGTTGDGIVTGSSSIAAATAATAPPAPPAEAVAVATAAAAASATRTFGSGANLACLSCVAQASSLQA